MPCFLHTGSSCSLARFPQKGVQRASERFVTARANPMQMVAMIGAVELADEQEMVSYSRVGRLLLTVAGAVLLPCHAFTVGSAAASASMESVAAGIMHGLTRVAFGEIFQTIVHSSIPDVIPYSPYEWGCTRCYSRMVHLSHGPWP